VTGARYRSSPKDPYDVTTLKRVLQEVRVQGAPASFHDPRKPFRYLGLQYTLNLDWTAQFEATREALKQMTRSMVSSYATTAQKVRTINSCLKAKVRYAFCVAPYTNGQLKVLDSIICKAVKQAYGLPSCMSNAAVHEDVDKGGMGCPSLLAEYTTVQIQRLITALNDPGPIGTLTQARLHQEKVLLDKLTVATHPALAQHSMRLRQLLACTRVNLEVRRNREELKPMADTNPLLHAISTVTESETLAGVNPPDPPALLILDLHHLRDYGLRHLKDLMSTTGRSILTPEQVKLKIGKCLTARTRTALRRVCYMLTIPPGVTKENYKSRPPPPTGQETIHADYARVLRSHHYIQDMDIRQATLPLLWTAQVQSACTEAAMDELQAHISKMINGRVTGQARASSIREVAPDITRRLTAMDAAAAAVNKTETGFCIYNRLTSETGSRNKNTPAGQTRKQRNKARNRKALRQLYFNYAEGVDIVAGIEGEQTAAAFIGRGRNRRRTTTQKQLVVRWEPAIMQGWMVNIAKDMGYQVEHAQQVGRAEIGQAPDLATECCGPNSHILEPEDSDDLILCDVCSRRYHIGCLPLNAHPKRPMQQQEGTAHHQHTGEVEPAAYPPWTCKECLTKKFTEATLPKDLRHYLVHWKPQAESQSDLCERNPTLRNMIDDYYKRKDEEQGNAPAALPPQRSKLAARQRQLTDMQQQGDYYPQHPQRYDIRLGEEWSNKFAMETNAINPHADIQPTGRHEVYIRGVEMRIDGQDWDKTLACIYTPDGRCRFTLTPTRAAILYQQYLHCAQYKPRLMKQLSAGTFAEELYALMCRYKDGAQVQTRTNKSSTIKVKNHWATPPEIYQALQDIMHIDKERFASPLNYNPRMRQYWSIMKGTNCLERNGTHTSTNGRGAVCITLNMKTKTLT
jgi:hypothetical protein